MNPRNNLCLGLGEAAGESSNPDGNLRSPPNIPEDMKRAAVQKLIEQYFYQLVDGCGNPECCNENCASGKLSPPISHNEAAVKALALCKAKAQLCYQASPTNTKQLKITHIASSEEASTSSRLEMDTMASHLGKTTLVASTSTSGQAPGCSMEHCTPQSGMATRPDMAGAPAKVDRKALLQPDHLTENRIMLVINSCKLNRNFSPLVRLIGEEFSSWRTLNKSFLKNTFADDKPVAKADTQCLDKEQEASFFNEKDEDETLTTRRSSPTKPEEDDLSIDLEAINRVYKALEILEEDCITNAMINAIIALSQTIELDICLEPQFNCTPCFLNVFIIVMENASLQSPEYLEAAYPSVCRAVTRLDLPARAKLARVWSKFPAESLRKKLESIQQLVTFKVLTDHFGSLGQLNVNNDETITSAVKFMKIIYYASILGGTLDQFRSLHAADSDEMDLGDLLGAVGSDFKEKKLPKEDPFTKELSVSFLDSTGPLIPFEEFYNETLSEQIDVGEDFARYKKDIPGQFSFLNYPFVLTAAVKNTGLYYDNRVQMYNERRLTMLNRLVLNNEQFYPYLRLKVRRTHVIDDALVRLEMIAMENPADLKKQLYVEFDGEQGVDEGGVSKEFFQLVIEDVFNPDIGMFTFNEDTSLYWFNSASFENDRQYTLIGIVLGLAIYNNIILDIQFPMVLYYKLMGRKGRLADLAQVQPVLYSSFKSLLEYEGNVEDMFMMTFVISYKDMFGDTISHSLLENGENVPVTNENRQEFVDRYVDYFLNKLSEMQFKAFKRGFDMVTDESPLKIWFRPEEVELLVCGSKNFDFDALEEATEYDGGYTKESTIIRNFWNVVHGMSEEQKKKLLMFTTGSDRIPVGGLAKLRLIIAKNGPDSDRLPTSHTCFNVLLLPEYSSKDKLEERLLKAITHAKGFGML